MPVLQLLGPVEVRDPRGQPVPLPRRRQRTLLALLVIRAGTDVTSDELIEAPGGCPYGFCQAARASFSAGLCW
jgi:hypothetical protein